mmetsp:Transcript_6085/g.7731  ORF Transcript_6085/g.7731 Transcript_6085/m.7731 type:complete len:130 (+) Transcript_6085:170-559(+)
MKFDTSTVDTIESKVTLRLVIADSHSTEPVDINMYSMQGDFDENVMNWDTFNNNMQSKAAIIFRIYSDYKDKVNEIDVTSLVTRGENVILAFLVEGEGHVKFHSKESALDESVMPKLIIKEMDDILRDF